MAQIKLSKQKYEKNKKRNKKKMVFYSVFFVLVFIAGYLITSNIDFSGWFSYKPDKLELQYGDDPFNNTIIDIAKIDFKYGTSLNDYYQGLEYLKWNPREKPMNTEDFDAVISELNELRENTEDNASLLLIDARIKLFEAEKHYTNGTRSQKSRIDDGWMCKELPYVEVGLANTELGIEKAKEAAADLEELVNSYSEQSEILQISKFWIKQFAITLDEINKTRHSEYDMAVKLCAEDSDNSTSTE